MSSPLDIAAIEARAHAAAAAPQVPRFIIQAAPCEFRISEPATLTAASYRPVFDSAADVPALVEEIRQLQSKLEVVSRRRDRWKDAARMKRDERIAAEDFANTLLRL